MRTIEQRAADFLTQAALPAGGILNCAVSGGPDSVTLLELMRKIAPEKGLSVEAAHPQPRAAGGGIRPGRGVCPRAPAGKRRSRSGPSGRGCPSGRGPAGESVESFARALRYDFFERISREREEETGAGCGSRLRTPPATTPRRCSSAGAGQFSRRCGRHPAGAGAYLRPLLAARGRRSCATVRCIHCGYVIDATNLEPCCSRNRIRLQVMPTLRKINPGAERALAAFAADAREDAAFLDQLAQELLCRARQGAGWRCATARVGAGTGAAVGAGAAAHRARLRGPGEIGACRRLLEGGGSSVRLSGKITACRSGGSSISKRPGGQSEEKQQPIPFFVGKQRLCDGRILRFGY